MPDEKKISELLSANDNDINEQTLIELAVYDASASTEHSSYNGALGAIFDKILRAVQFTQRLTTHDTRVFGAINELNENKNIAYQFSTSATYAVGDYVIYDGQLYKCITAISTAGAWDVTKWDAVVVTDEMGSGGGGTANMTELTQAEYDALEQAGQLIPDMMYFITDGQAGTGDIIDDSTTSTTKVWSSDKTDDEIQAVATVVSGKQDDLSCGQLASVDLDDYKTNGFYWVTQTSVSNKPTTNFGYLIVAKPSTVIQIFICFGNDSTATRGDMYVRFYANNQWYSWAKIADSIPDTIKVSRTNLSQGAGVSKWAFSAPAITGYTRMIIGANSSNSLAQFVRFEENGNNLDVYINNTGNSSVTYDMTIAVAYIRN